MEQRILAKPERDLLSLLKEAQHNMGYVSTEQMLQIAEELGIAPGQVYGVTTFYSFLATRPAGKNIIRICRSVPCDLKEVDSIAKIIEDVLGIKPGETTKDGRFSLSWVNCLGVCDQAPAMMINEQVYADLTPQRVVQILDKYKRSESE